VRGTGSNALVNRREVAATSSCVSACFWTSRESGRITGTSRRALLEQELRGLDHRLSVEAHAHQPGAQHVGQGHHGHALVVRHVAVDDDEPRVLGQAPSRVVERLIEAVGTAPAGGLERDQVPGRRRRVDHRGESRGVRGDDQVLAQTPREAEPGNAEARVLVGQVEIAHAERGLRDAPGHAAAERVGDLALDHQATRLVEQAAVRRVHDEPGHQVLEHRARPGHERDSRLDRRHRPRQLEPVRGRDVAAGDRHEARQPRFRRQEVVAALVEGSVGHAVADGEELPRPVEEKAEIRVVEQAAGGSRHRFEPLQRLLARDSGALERLDELGDRAGVESGAPFLDLARGRARLLRKARQRERRPEQSLDRARLRAIGWRQKAARVGQRVEPWRERIQIALMARDGRLHGLGPDRCRSAGRAVGLTRLVGEVSSRGREFAQPDRPLDDRGGLAGQTVPYLGDRRSQHGRRCAPSADRQGLAEAEERGVDAAKRVDTDERPLLVLVRGDGEDAQVSGQIAAIDRRHVPRLERLERLRVVPVVEVPPEALELAHGCQRGPKAIEDLERADPAEIARGHRGEQKDAHVRRRGPVRDDGPRILLEVVRRQEVILARHERLEEPPARAGCRQERLPVLVGHVLGRPRRRRPADASRDDGGKAPEDHERGGDDPALAAAQHGHRTGGDGEREPALHAREHGGEIEARVGLHLRGRDPLEHAPARDGQAQERAAHRIRHQPSLVRQERERERELHAGHREAPRDAAQIRALREARPLRDDLDRDRDERREGQAEQDQPGPDEGRVGG